MISKKDQVMQAALQLFVERGFDGTSTAEISKKAGVAAGTLFHHFDNKENLINAIYMKVKSDISETFRLAVDPNNDAKTNFLNVWTSFMRFCVDRPNQFRFTEIFSNSPQISERTAEQAKAQFLDILHNLIVSGRREGSLKDLPDELTFSIMTSPSVATAWYLIENPTELENQEFMDLAAASCWRAISND